MRRTQIKPHILFPLMSLVLTLLFVFLVLIPRAHAIAPRHPKKSTIDQHCVVISDLNAGDVEKEVKKLNVKGIRVTYADIRIVGDKFAIVTLDGQDEPDDESDN